MKTHVETPAAVDWSRARALLDDLKSAVRLSLALQILLGLLLATYKKRLGFIRGRHIVIRQRGGSSKSWDQYCQDEMGIATRSCDRYIQCFEAAYARAKNLRAKACGLKAKALEAGEAEESEKWEKVIKKCDRAIGLLQTSATDLNGGEEKELMVHVGFLIQRQDREKHATAAANITQGELLEELGIKRASDGVDRRKKQQTENEKKGDQKKLADVISVDLFSRITRGFGELEKEIIAARQRAEFYKLLQSIQLTPSGENVPGLYAIRDALRSVPIGEIESELKKMIEAVESTIREREHPAASAKPRRMKPTKA